jgi:hypothetical protein
MQNFDHNIGFREKRHFLHKIVDKPQKLSPSTPDGGKFSLRNLLSRHFN